MLYTVGEIAQKMNIAPSTLRYYDKEGLLPFIERSSGGIRMFKDSDIEWLSIIECLKMTGMPIKDIKKFIDWCIEGDPTIEKRLELIQHQYDAVEKQIRQLQQMQKLLGYKRWYYETAKKAGTCSIHDHTTAEDIPEDFRDVWKRSKTGQVR